VAVPARRRGPSRRGLLAGALGLAALAAPPAIGRPRPRLVVVGGGAAGANIVRRVAATGSVEVTLVEPEAAFFACFRSNLVLGGLEDLAALARPYAALVDPLGVRHVRSTATAIDRDARHVVLTGGERLAYDRLVVAPGIALVWDSVPGWGRAAAEAMPHAFKGRAQFVRLAEELATVPNGGLVVILPPPDPSRCPPAPYERASMIAHTLKATGRGDCHVVIVDCKERFSKMALFLDGWERHFPAMIEWLPPSIHGGVLRVDAATMTVETDFETYRGCALVNVIPAQTAGRIAVEAGLADASGFCPVDAASMAAADDPAVFVVGDAAVAGDMPKSAYAAWSQARVASAAILAGLVGTPPPPAEYASTCWSLVDVDDGVKVSGDYRPEGGRITETAGLVSALGEDVAVRLGNAANSEHWYRAMIDGLFPGR